MKRWLMLGIGLSVYSLPSAQTWENISPAGASEVLFFDVEFIDDDHGFAVGQNTNNDEGFIYKTTDGGQTWTFESWANRQFTTVDYMAPSKAYVSGFDGPPGTAAYHYFTPNNGSSWTTANSSGISTGFKGMEFFDQTHGLAYGYGSIFAVSAGIFETNDGGTTWSPLFSDQGLLEDGQFVNEDTVYLSFVTSSWPAAGLILRSTDGGSNFLSLYTGEWISSTYFINSDRGFAIEGLSSKRLKVTDDGGNTWTDVTLDDNIDKIRFITDSIGYISGDAGTIYKTEDAGDTWQLETTPTAQELEGVSHGPNYAYSFGYNGTIIRSAHGADLGSGPVNPTPTFDPPTLSAPLDNAANTNMELNLVWGSVQDAVNYHVQLAEDTAFTQLIVDGPSTATTKLVTALGSEQTYYWRVRANFSGGQSEWSPVWSFTTKENTPDSWPVGIIESGLQGFQVYPNPTLDKVTIQQKEYRKSGVSVRIYDLGGRLQKQHMMNSSSLSMDLSDLDQGIYIIELSSQGQHYTQRLMKL